MVMDTDAGFADVAPTLQVELESLGATCRLILHGVLCGTSLAALEAQVDQLGCMPCDEVVVDLQSLSMLDSVGANVLLGLYYYVTARGGTFRVVHLSGEVAATLQSVAGTEIPTEHALLRH